jgi:predicted PurR-regulated permease PerM
MSLTKFLFEKKHLILNSFFIFIIILLIFNDSLLLLSIIFGFIIGKFGSKISNFLKNKLKIPIILSSAIIILCIACALFISIYYLGEILLEQSKKIILIILNEEFLKQKTQIFHQKFEIIIQKIKFLKKTYNIPDEIFNQTVNFFNSIPITVQNKINEYSVILIKNSYISGLKILNILYSILLSLIIGFFIMYDFEKITNIINRLFGIYYEKFNHQLDSFKSLISKMLIGQIKVAFILFSIYSICFWFLNFEYYILYSLIFAVLTLIPILGQILSICILFLSFYIFDFEFAYNIKILIAFLIGYFLENFYLTPKLVGSSLNVHPLMILIGLIIFSKFFGIIGIFLALPIIASIVQIIERYYLKENILKK